MGRAINKENSLKNDYFGGIVLIIISAIFVCVVYLIFNTCSPYGTKICWEYGFSIGGTLAIAFQIIFYIAGGLKRPIDAVIKRWKNFFSDLQISFKFAIEGVLDSFKDDGIVLLWYLLIMLCTINMCVHGFSYLIAFYGL